jgi:hypothetical protein
MKRYNFSFLQALYITISSIYLITLPNSCKKFVDVNPPDNSIGQDNIYEDNITATAVLTALYSKLSATLSTAFELPAISTWTGLSSDEFNLWSGADNIQLAYWKNALAAPAIPVANVTSAGHEIWNASFPMIYNCNAAIEGLTKSNRLSLNVKNQLLGEAKFMRAFFYFYLVNLYGDLPLATTTRYDENRLLSRSPQLKVYELIISDLTESEKLLSNNYLSGALISYTGKAERVRPTKWAAMALLSRVYLYRKQFDLAEAKASEVISNSTLFSLPSLDNVFLKNSNEAIWQLQPIIAGWNTEDAKMFDLSTEPVDLGYSKPVYLSDNQLSAFEPGDLRKMKWVGRYTSGTDNYYFPYKYKASIYNADITSYSSMTEYRMVLRLAEQYLIRAEARAQQNKIAEAVADLNTLRARAKAASTADVPDPLPAIPIFISQSQLLTAILHERQVELFSEWGHRWFDLKRTGMVDAVMSVVTPQKSGGAWETTDQLYPIPYSDIDKNPNLQGHQNAGY